MDNRSEVNIKIAHCTHVMRKSKSLAILPSYTASHVTMCNYLYIYIHMVNEHEHDDDDDDF